MTASSPLPAPNLMPLMRYRDLAEAMGWLEQAFGFEKQIAVSDGDGGVIYGQMTYRGGLIMMGAVRDTDLDKLMRQPDEVGGVETQSCYLVVDDADQHYARATEQGAEIVLELKSDGLGRRGYSCRDPEGHIWSFGTYSPGKNMTTAVATPPAIEPETPAPPSPRRGRRLLMALAGLLMLGGGAHWLISNQIVRLPSTFAESTEADRAYAELVKVRAEKRQAEERLATLTRELNSERQRIAAVAAEPAASQELAQERAAREAAEKALASVKDDLKREQAEHDAAVEAKRVLEEKLAARSAAQETAPPAAASPPQAPSPSPQAKAEESPAPASEATSPSRIETSATNREQDPIPAADGDEDQQVKQTSDVKRDRIAKSQKPRRSEPSPPKRDPLYATEVQHTWPYSQWSQ